MPYLDSELVGYFDKNRQYSEEELDGLSSFLKLEENRVETLLEYSLDLFSIKETIIEAIEAYLQRIKTTQLVVGDFTVVRYFKKDIESYYLK